MLWSRVFANFHHPIRSSDRSPRSVILSASFIQSLWFHTVTHSFARRATHICLIFNHFRTLSIVTEGVGGLSVKNSTTPGLSPIPCALSPFFSDSCPLFCTFFALIKNPTRLFSSVSAL